MSHYFTDNTDMHHNRKVLSFRFLGVSYRFHSDAGVFSKSQVDFGSELLLSAIMKHGITGTRVLDLGCGYGILAIVIQKNTNAMVTAADVNPRAVALCDENAIENKVTVHTVNSDVTDNVTDLFDTIVTNPPIRAGKQVVYRFFQEAYDHLGNHGMFWVVIRKEQGAPSAMRELTRIYGNCELVTRDKGYFILRCEKC